MKTLVIMGGGVNQVPLIKASLDMGYHTVLCDANPQAYARDLADEFVVLDISDAGLLTELCREKKADGIICNTESLMEVLADVQTQCGFVGNTVDAVRNINDKYRFRGVQRKAKVFSPELERFDKYADLQEYAQNLNYGVILKPEMCSGSRGVAVFASPADITEEAFEVCAKYSRNHYVMVEQFIDFSSQPALEAEMFVRDGKLQLLCLFRTLRDKKRNILPQCYCADNELDPQTEQRVRDELQNIISVSGIQFGEYNVELSFNNEGEIFVIEINARQGGMMLPDFVHIYTNIDINKLLVSTAVNDLSYEQSLDMNADKWNKNCIHFRVLTDKSGTYQGYTMTPESEKYVAKRFSYSCPGDTIHCSDNNYSTVELLDFVLPDKDTRKKYEQLLFDAVSVKMN